MSFSGRKNPSGIRPLLNVSLPLEATNLCNKHQASSRRFMSRLARFFEIAPGIRRAVHQPSCSFRHNSAAIPSKTLTVLSQRVCASAPGQANELAGIRLRRQAAHRARTLPSAWPAPSISPVWPVRTRSSGSGLPAMPVNWRSFGKTPGRPRANGLARPSTATTSRLKTLWGCGLLVLSDRMAMKAAFRAS